MEADFPIPFENQHPESDLRSALSLLSVLSSAIDGHEGVNHTAASGFLILIDEIRYQLAPISQFLDDLDYDRLLVDYQTARRKVIVQGVA